MTGSAKSGGGGDGSEIISVKIEVHTHFYIFQHTKCFTVRILSLILNCAWKSQLRRLQNFTNVLIFQLTLRWRNFPSAMATAKRRISILFPTILCVEQANNDSYAQNSIRVYGFPRDETSFLAYPLPYFPLPPFPISTTLSSLRRTLNIVEVQLSRDQQLIHIFVWDTLVRFGSSTVHVYVIFTFL